MAVSLLCLVLLVPILIDVTKWKVKVRSVWDFSLSIGAETLNEQALEDGLVSILQPECKRWIFLRGAGHFYGRVDFRTPRLRPMLPGVAALRAAAAAATVVAAAATTTTTIASTATVAATAAVAAITTTTTTTKDVPAESRMPCELTWTKTTKALTRGEEFYDFKHPLSGLILPTRHDRSNASSPGSDISQNQNVSPDLEFKEIWEAYDVLVTDWSDERVLARSMTSRVNVCECHIGPLSDSVRIRCHNCGYLQTTREDDVVHASICIAIVRRNIFGGVDFGQLDPIPCGACCSTHSHNGVDGCVGNRIGHVQQEYVLILISMHSCQTKS